MIRKDIDDEGTTESTRYVRMKASQPSIRDSFRSTNDRLLNHQGVKQMFSFLIIINGITMGITTFDFVTKNHAIYLFFETVDFIFLSIFTIELAMNFLHYGWDLFTKNWLVFDATIISISWVVQGMAVFRVFRIFRLLRLITHIPELHMLVETLVRVIPSMTSIGSLLLLVYYVFAVMFTTMFKSLYKDGHTTQDYFSRLDTTMFTLFQIMTLDDWTAITKEVAQVYPWTSSLFIIYITVSSFVVINLVVGVLVDAVGKNRQEKTIEQFREIQEEYSGTGDEYTELKFYRLSEDVECIKDSLWVFEKQVEEKFLILSNDLIKLAQNQEKICQLLEGRQ